MPRFVDTNVLLYALSDDPGEKAKRDAALSLLRAPDLALSTQVLAEFHVQATRPSRPHPVAHADAVAFAETLLVFTIQPVTTDVVRAAFAIQSRFDLSFWDAQIVAAARTAGCRELLTEDLNTGQDYDGVIAVDPFAVR
ncbi:PIN domain-containing protein [Microbacterium gilvum]|uniref:Ribonuclease VapC n=1 Tax=Microbacterium gilvum TaxID=1336204 RepID=A0ABP9AM54_9MICO